jgi:NAD(P)-dependent dehydrogenase (short-subunit alcohol dehydrogenase family)
MHVDSATVACVTGAGSGIGRGMALAFAARGAPVAVCDIRGEAAAETAGLIRAAGGRALPLALDVSDAGAVAAAAEHVAADLGPVRILCNNAGVAMHGVPLHEIALDDWNWVISVNVLGVVHGIRAFVPGMLASGLPCHVVNTASIGGFQVNPGFLTGAYSMTKYAVVALSEGLRNEMAGTQVGVSVLAPAAVATGIHLSGRARPDRLGGPTERPQNHFMGDLIRDGADPAAVGARVLAAIEGGEFYIFTHPETRDWLRARHAAIEAAFGAAPAMRAAAE